MSLKTQIEADIKKAMLAKEKDELRALRGIKSLILLAETEKGSGTELDQDTELKLLMKAAKQRKESAEVYKTSGREDLAKVELDEYEVISRYLPKQISADELATELKKIIEQVGAKGSQDMGKVMGAATKALGGKADNKAISEAVKTLLS